MRTKISFISGGPSTGKTAVVNFLEKKGFEILPEAAREIAMEKFFGKSILEIDMKIFQREIFNLQKKMMESIKDSKNIIFSDRGFGDTIAYCKINKVKIPKIDLEYAEKFNYAKVFIFEPLNFYKKDFLRRESKEEQRKIQDEIIKSYLYLGYKITDVPFMSVEKRVDFVLKNLGVPNL